MQLRKGKRTPFPGLVRWFSRHPPTRNPHFANDTSRNRIYINIVHTSLYQFQINKNVYYIFKYIYICLCGVYLRMNVMPYADSSDRKHIKNFELKAAQANIEIFEQSVSHIVHVLLYAYSRYNTPTVCMYVHVDFGCLQPNFNSHHLQHQQKFKRARQISSNVSGIVLFWGLLCGRRCARLAFVLVRLVVTLTYV